MVVRNLPQQFRRGYSLVTHRITVLEVTDLVIGDYAHYSMMVMAAGEDIALEEVVTVCLDFHPVSLGDTQSRIIKDAKRKPPGHPVQFRLPRRTVQQGGPVYRGSVAS
jgi:hypothetical protein